jgi:hypothetical protein
MWLKRQKNDEQEFDRDSKKRLIILIEQGKRFGWFWLAKEAIGPFFEKIKN